MGAFDWVGDAWDATGGWAWDQLSGAAGTQGGSAPAPKYGEARSGGGPNRNNFYLGGSEGYAGQLANQYHAAGLEQKNAQNAYAGNMQNSGTGALAAQSGIGSQARGYGTQAGNRAIAPTAGYAGAQGDMQGQQRSAGQLAGYGAQLQRMAGQPEGPSAAQAQLQQGTNQALAGQLALMRSGGTAGQSAAAGDSARFNAAGLQANQANAAAALRAQENAQYRDRQLSTMGLAGQMQSAAGGMYGQGADRATQQSQFDAQNRLNQQQLNDQTALAGLGLSSQAYGQGYDQQLAAQQAASAASAQGYNAYNQGQQGAFNAQLANMQGGMGYEGQLGDMYGAELGHQTEMRGLDQQKSKDTIGAFTGMMEGGTQALMMAAGGSDRRMKKNIRASSVLDEYRALGGK